MKLYMEENKKSILFNKLVHLKTHNTIYLRNDNQYPPGQGNEENEGPIL